MKPTGFRISRFWLFFWVALLAVFMIGSGFYQQQESVPEPVQTVEIFLGDLPKRSKADWQGLSSSEALYFLEMCLELTE